MMASILNNVLDDLTTNVKLANLYGQITKKKMKRLS